MSMVEWSMVDRFNGRSGCFEINGEGCFSLSTTKEPRETFRCLIPFSLSSLPSSASAAAVARLISSAAGDTNATMEETEGGEELLFKQMVQQANS